MSMGEVLESMTISYNPSKTVHFGAVCNGHVTAFSVRVACDVCVTLSVFI